MPDSTGFIQSVFTSTMRQTETKRIGVNGYPQVL